jgi:F-type H+-transporting ATPase subunit a
MAYAIEFPPISHVVEWPALWLEDTPFEVNKVVLLMWLSAVIVFAFFYIAARRPKFVPSGVQNLAEATVDFIRETVVLQTMGPEGEPWMPFLLTLFGFIFVGNIWEVVPLAQMPVNARIAYPALMAVVVWLLYHFIGIKRQGAYQYFKVNMFPPGVPMPMYLLVTPIHTVTFLITQPLSLAVRLFANMLAGHLLLVSFATITAAVWAADISLVVWPFSFGLLVVLTIFEVLVAFLQAFIFTILTAVYIANSMHPEH